MNRTRPNQILLRLSDSELEDFRARLKASGYTAEQFLLRAVFDKPIIEKETYQKLLIELRRQGVNLNQISRSCNSGNTEIEKQRIKTAIKELEQLWQSLKL